MALEIKGQAIPNIPWQDSPQGCDHVMWRYSANPVIPRDLLPTSNSIFNSAVVPYGRDGWEFAGVFRVDDTNRRMRIHSGFSHDGINWHIDESDVVLTGADPEIAAWEYGYDPRVAHIDDRYWVTWCSGYHGPTIGVAWMKISAPSTSLKTHFCHTTATVCCSPQDKWPLCHALTSKRY